MYSVRHVHDVEFKNYLSTYAIFEKTHAVLHQNQVLLDDPFLYRINGTVFIIEFGKPQAVDDRLYLKIINQVQIKNASKI